MIEYKVETLREVGLEAKWVHTKRGPILVARDPHGREKHQRDQWWYVDSAMWESMKKHGIVEGFDQSTLLGNYFSFK